MREIEFVNFAKKLHETPSRLQKRHDFIEAPAAFEVGIHNGICLDPTLLVFQILEFVCKFIVPVLKFGHI